MEQLKEPLSLVKTRSALYSMQNAKVLGPDGFTVKFFKGFGDKLLPILLTVFEESFAKGQLSSMFFQAPTSVILKKGRDPLSCWS